MNMNILANVIESITLGATDSVRVQLRTRILDSVNSEHGKLRETKNLSKTSLKEGKIRVGKPTKDGQHKMSVTDRSGQTFSAGVTPALMFEAAVDELEELAARRLIRVDNVTIDWLTPTIADWLKSKRDAVIQVPKPEPKPEPEPATA